MYFNDRNIGNSSLIQECGAFFRVAREGLCYSSVISVTARFGFLHKR